MKDPMLDMLNEEEPVDAFSFFDDIMGRVEQEQAAMDSLGSLFGMLAALPTEEEAAPRTEGGRRVPGEAARKVLQDEDIFAKIIEEYGSLMEEETLGPDEA